MVIREDLVASAAQFLQDPSVANSSLDNRVAFLRTKNLTQEEIDVALARAGSYPPVPQPNSQVPTQYFQHYPQYAWQQPTPPVPRRDWRDWFIMATVVGGVGFGLFELGKRYVYPLIAPPTPERLAQDKKSIEEQFDKAFALVDQLAKDTEALKAAEQERTARLDAALEELEQVIAELKSANGRREDEAQRIRSDVQSLKEAIPKAMSAQKDVTDTRLQDINTELLSLKTLVSQRMGSQVTATANGPHGKSTNGHGSVANGTTARSGSPSAGGESVWSAPNSGRADTTPTVGQSSGLGTLLSGKPTGKASIPAWQMAMAGKSENESASASVNDGGSSS